MIVSEDQWKKETVWEKQWWGDCTNTLREELLQMAYAIRMGLVLWQNDRSPYNIDLHGKSVLDIGGGPVSMLLKCVNKGRTIVVDPCEFPKWVHQRYLAADIAHLQIPAEQLTHCQDFDEVWIYNVLQHTMNPQLIVDNAVKAAKIVRVFEFIDAGVSPGHPHNLTEETLNQWFGGTGRVEDFREHGAVGKVYWGAFTK